MNPFVSPNEFDHELKSFLEEASKNLCEWFAKNSEDGPLPTSNLLFDVALSSEGQSNQTLLDDLSRVMKGAYQPSHPGALAHLDPPPLTASIAAELISAGLNNNLLAEELSPSLSKLERDICNWLAERFSLPLTSGGVAASGGSLSNLMALVVARSSSGLRGDPSGVVFASVDAHISILKAINVMGLASDSLQLIPTNQKGEMDIESLRQKLALLKSQGRNVIAVVATAGTTLRGAVDSLTEIGNFCKREDIWFHVDGAIGGIFALSKKTASIVNGICLADSITLNPQKLLGITKTSSLLLVANRSNLISTFSTGLPYIEPRPEDEPNGGEMGLQGSRPGEVLKLWLGLRQLGESGITNVLESAIERRLAFEKKIDRSKFEILTGPLHMISLTPRNMSIEDSVSWSKMTREKLLAKKFMLSRPFHENRYYLKAVFGNPHTTTFHIKTLASLLNQSVRIFSND